MCGSARLPRGARPRHRCSSCPTWSPPCCDRALCRQLRDEEEAAKGKERTPVRLGRIETADAFAVVELEGSPFGLLEGGEEGSQGRSLVPLDDRIRPAQHLQILDVP